MSDLVYNLVHQLFQFQLVRLKPRQKHHRARSCFVSIPIGSIKTKFFKIELTLSMLFQFQLVRLKQDNEAQGARCFTEFQFQLVRLKRSVNF